MRKWLERAGKVLSVAVAVYLLLWLACILWFWLSIPFSGAGIFGYTLLVYSLALPIASAIACALVGWRTELGNIGWLSPVVGALLYVAALLLTFSLSTALTMANIAPVDLAAFHMGLVPGAVGCASGRLLRRFRDSRR